MKLSLKAMSRELTSSAREYIASGMHHALCTSSSAGLGKGKIETEHTEQGGFDLEGAQGDYSGSMGVFVCRGTFRRLASVGLPAKTPN